MSMVATPFLAKLADTIGARRAPAATRGSRPAVAARPAAR
jgi:hypothetical protein